MRPVERAVASLISRMGGSAQPASRDRTGMLCEAAPVWRFRTSLEADEDPERAWDADDGLFIMEVFPALALASLGPGFFGRVAGPRYNLGRATTFRAADWVKVAEMAAAETSGFGCVDLAGWCRAAGALAKPRKADQDMLDAALCTPIALRWRLGPRAGLPPSWRAHERLHGPAREPDGARKADGRRPEVLGAGLVRDPSVADQTGAFERGFCRRKRGAGAMQHQRGLSPSGRLRSVWEALRGMSVR